MKGCIWMHVKLYQGNANHHHKPGANHWIFRFTERRHQVTISPSRLKSSASQMPRLGYPAMAIVRENGKPPLAAGMPIFIDKAWYQCGINVNIPLFHDSMIPLFIINIIFHYSVDISPMSHIQSAGHLVYLGAVQHDLFADALGTAHHIVWRQVPGAALMPAAVASTGGGFLKGRGRGGVGTSTVKAQLILKFVGKNWMCLSLGPLLVLSWFLNPSSVQVHMKYAYVGIVMLPSIPTLIF